MFLSILAIGTLLVLAQALASYCDGYFSQKQMRMRGKSGTSFLQHGGMWCDLIIVSPIVAGIVAHYKLPYLSWYCLILIAVLLVLLIIVGPFYARLAIEQPEAHSHDGKTTFAGRIHGLYAGLALWIILMFYFASTEPRPSTEDLLFVSGILTLCLILGVVKFDRRWKWSALAEYQVMIEIVILWAITLAKIKWSW